MAKTNRPEVEVVKKAVEALSIHFDNVVAFANRFDPTTGRTVAVSITEGNRFAVIGHVNAWLDDVMNEDDDCDGCNCGSCDCGADPEDHDDAIGGDDDSDDTIGNR